MVRVRRRKNKHRSTHNIVNIDRVCSHVCVFFFYIPGRKISSYFHVSRLRINIYFFCFIIFSTLPLSQCTKYYNDVSITFGYNTPPPPAAVLFREGEIMHVIFPGTPSVYTENRSWDGFFVPPYILRQDFKTIYYTV